MRNRSLHLAGLAMGAANAVRHRHEGYVNPRPFSPSELERTIDHALEIVERWEAAGTIDWTGKHVLECGPGSDLTTGAIVMARGAASYRAVDFVDNRGQAAPGLYDALARRLGVPVDVDALGFTVATFPGLPEATGSYDVIVSNAALEHIEHMDELFASFHRLAAPGARMVHHVDAQTHMRWLKDVDPLNVLRYSDVVYDKLLSFPGAPNRLRVRDYEDAARGAGWAVVGSAPAITVNAAYVGRVQVARRFRGRPDLAVLAFTLVADRDA
jgi:SAM-dependent methyltransferase